jgi:hypothetical protein
LPDAKIRWRIVQGIVGHDTSHAAGGADSVLLASDFVGSGGGGGTSGARGFFNRLMNLMVQNNTNAMMTKSNMV